LIWILSLLSAYLYWVAGRGNDEKVGIYAPSVLREKLTRRLGCSLLLTLTLLPIWLKSFNLMALALFIAANFAFLSTYHDYLGEEGTLPNGEKFREENTACFIVTGLFYGLAALPLIWCDIALYSIIWRSIALAIAIPVIRKIPNVHLQESLSGFVYLASILIII